MKIKCDKAIQASIDDGVTVTTWKAGENEVPDWVGEMAKKHYGALEVGDDGKTPDPAKADGKDKK